MASLGKKILSAFVEVTDEDTEKKEPKSESAPRSSQGQSTDRPPVSAEVSSKFSEHFHKLFAEANLPGPDYYEFAKMTEAMQIIADEKARFAAAFAGLQVQGLDKQKLLSSAQEYIKILEADAAAFHNSVDAALYEKVQSKKDQLQQATTKIQDLSKEIVNLQNQIKLLEGQITEGEEKIQQSTHGYEAALEGSRSKLQQDMEKIKQYIP